MGYVGAETIPEFQEKARFMRITSAGFARATSTTSRSPARARTIIRRGREGVSDRTSLAASATGVGGRFGMASSSISELSGSADGPSVESINVGNRNLCRIYDVGL